MQPALRSAAFAPFLILAGCGEPVPQPSPALVENRAEPAAPATAAPAAIPVRLRGRWDASNAACAGPAGEMRLVVGPDQLRFHESVARLEAIREAGDDRASLDLAFEGEGESWRETRTLRLLPDGRLSVESEQGTAVRARCDGAAEAAASPRWTSAASGEGDGLTLAAPDGTRRITFFCPARSDQLLVNLPAFRAVASEERMTIGSGAVAAALVADSGGDAARGVSATGRVPAELDAILAGPAAISVNYGSQDAGPFPPPPPDLAAAFVRGCRE